MAIAKLSDIKTYLSLDGCDDDELLRMLLSSAQATVETFTGRQFEADAEDREEIVDGKAQRSILLKKYPVISVTSVERNVGTLDVPVWEEVPASSYRVDANVGAVDFLCGTQRGLGLYKVSYKGGYATVPSDILLSVLKIAASNKAKRNSDGISSETVNGDSVTFDTKAIPSDVESILVNYRRPHV